MNFYFKQSINLAIVSIIIYSVLFLVENSFSYTSFYSIWGISLFFFISTLIVVSFIKLVHQYASDKVGFAFMGLILFKAFACILFLLPGFTADVKPDFTAILFFFVPYFIFLIYEVIQAIKMLNQ